MQIFDFVRECTFCVASILHFSIRQTKINKMYGRVLIRGFSKLIPFTIIPNRSPIRIKMTQTVHLFDRVYFTEYFLPENYFDISRPRRIHTHTSHRSKIIVLTFKLRERSSRKDLSLKNHWKITLEFHIIRFH